MKISDLKIALVRKKLLALAEGSTIKSGSRKIGIIIDSERENIYNSFLKFKEELNLKQEDFYLVFCSEKPSKIKVFDIPVISRNDFGWNGKSSEAASGFLDAEYDVLISFAASENMMADFLVSVSKARLKVGRKTEDKKSIFDLNIATAPNHPEIFITELKKYLKILNTTTG